MMIVSLVRPNLREESEMADEAFALSPISARAVLPTEQDYDAISEAFMETSRGRWFLGEYAKRNRNADTRMVLDVVGRIEETLAAQKQPPPESRLSEALASVRQAIEEAQAAAGAAIESVAAEESLAPVHKAARIIKEISWRWREIGADSRICDLLDSQVSAIEGACGQMSSQSPQRELSAAFDLIRARIVQLEDRQTSSSRVAGTTARSAFSAADADGVLTPALNATAEILAPSNLEAEINMPAEAVLKPVQPVEPRIEVGDAITEAAEAAPKVVATPPGAVDSVNEAAGENAEINEPYDDALLDIVAQEMGAQDFIDIDDGLDEMHVPEPPPPEPIVVFQKPEPIAAQPEPAVKPALRPSLGSTLLANGIVRRSNPAASDPLAPIRRMSQAEKIAFFS
jgi:hypothetical protein